MTATTTVVCPCASSIPSSLRTSGHATPNHGSRSSTPVRMNRVLRAHPDVISAPIHLETDATEEGRHVRRSSSAHALDSQAIQRVGCARRRRLSVTTFGESEAPSCPVSCRDAAATIVADVLARRQLAEAASQLSPPPGTLASSPILAIQMPLAHYAMLGPDASVALASSQIADPGVQCVVVAVPGATHVLAREDVERLARYSHDPGADTVGSFLIGSPPAPSLYFTADVAAAAGLLLERSDACFLAVVEDTGGGGFLGLVSRTDLALALLGDRSCVYEPMTDRGSRLHRGAAAGAAGAACVAGDGAADAAPAPADVAAGSPLLESMVRGGVVCGRASPVHLPRPPILPSLPPPQPSPQHRQVNSARLATATTAASVLAAAAATTTAVAVGPDSAVAAAAETAWFRSVSAGSASEAPVAPLEGPTSLTACASAGPGAVAGELGMSAAGELPAAPSGSGCGLSGGSGPQLLLVPPPPPPPQLLLPPPRPSGSLLAAQHTASAETASVEVEQPAVGMRSFSDPIRSGWDMLDNVDDALDVLGMVGKSVNAEAVGRRLLGDLMGAAANVAGGSSGSGWLFKYLYDGDCSICRTFQAMLEKLDNGVGRVMFVDISAQGFNSLEHGGVNYRAAMETIHILSANGQIFKGVTAVIKLLAAVDPEIAANMGVVTAALPLLSLTYMLVSKNRHHLAKVWTQVLRITRADVALFGRSIMEPREGQGQQQQQQKGLGLGSAFGLGPAGLAGSSLWAWERGRGGAALRSHQLQTQPSA